MRQKQLSADQLQYELSTESRRAADEVAALKQRVAELELQLAQTRREADEYFKSGLERNAQATSLSNQVRSENCAARDRAGDISSSCAVVQSKEFRGTYASVVFGMETRFYGSDAYSMLFIVFSLHLLAS